MAKQDQSDKMEAYAVSAIRALQTNLADSGCTEIEALLILRIVTTKLEKVLDAVVNGNET